MGTQYEVLLAIAIKKEWWVPDGLANYWKQDCINYWNGMIENVRLRNEYQAKRKLKNKGLFCGALNFPKKPRRPMRRA